MDRLFKNIPDENSEEREIVIASLLLDYVTPGGGRAEPIVFYLDNWIHNTEVVQSYFNQGNDIRDMFIFNLDDAEPEDFPEAKTEEDARKLQAASQVIVFGLSDEFVAFLKDELSVFERLRTFIEDLRAMVLVGRPSVFRRELDNRLPEGHTSLLNCVGSVFS